MADTIMVASPDHNMARSRSTTGCWTCRVRRKKCDERIGECMTCLSLHLDCAGYGARPFWMDGGTREKEKAQEIKTKVTKQRKRGRPKRHSRRQSTVVDSSSQQVDVGPTSTGPSASSMGGSAQADNDRPTALPSPTTTQSMSNMGEIMQTDNGRSTAMPTPGREDWEGHSSQGSAALTSELNALPTSTTLSANETSYIPACAADQANNSQTPMQILANTPTGFDFDSQPVSSPWDKIWDSNVPYTTVPVGADDPVLAFDSIFTTLDCPAPSLEQPFDALLDLNSPKEERIDGDPNITYYLNDVIPNTFPFLSRRVYTLLREKLLAYENTSNALVRSSIRLLCSFLHKVGLKRIGLSQNSAGGEEAASSGRTEASDQVKGIIREAYRGLTSTPSELDADVLLCLLQLVQLQVECRECAFHVFLTDTYQIRRGLPDNDNVSGLIETLLDRSESLMLENDPLTTFVCRFAITTDILWSASKRRRPLRTFDAAGVARFDPSTADMYEVAGSEFWVLQYIAEINMLRLWKRDCLASHSLNVAEMVKRATTMEQGMQESRQRSVLNFESRKIGKDVLSITNVYAAAAQVYLHVVVSGALPEVSDIRGAVEMTVNAINAMSHATLVRRLAWPICVAASLTESRHEPFFNQLENGVRGDQDECTSVLRALQLARECRRLRQQSSSTTETFDWMDAMESLGHEWILF